MQRIVILGGGYAGIAAAKRLGKLYKKRKDIEITLVDKNTYHTLMTELHEVAGSRVDPDSVMVSYERIFEGTRVKVVTDFITGIDFDKKELVSDDSSYPYDYLVIGTGGAPEFFDIQGIQQNSFSLWSLEDAIRNVRNMKFVTSNSRESVSSLLVRFEDIDARTFDKRINDLRREIQNAEDELPEQAEDPEILEITSANAFPSATIAVVGRADDENLPQQARNTEKDLERLAAEGMKID